MQTITVPLGERSYPIHIERGLLAKTGAMIREKLGDIAVAVVSDDHVAPLYMEEVVSSMEKVGLRVCSIVLPHGEQTKCLKSLETLYAFLCEHHLTRKDAIVALGGGVIGDLAGLAAATYLRGVHFVQLPTTLLAQVDSSVGGKVAVDLPEGKNLVGAFYQPSLVLIDPLVLNTLKERFINDGMGEVIKYGCIKDADLFSTLESHSSFEDLKEELPAIITRCVDIKRMVVENDQFDTGERMLLNFGHTLAHTIEQHFHYQRESHGEAVAIGMYQITRIAEEKGLTPKGTAERIQKVLKTYGLPFECGLTLGTLTEAIALDKKNLNGNLNVILLHEIGDSYIEATDIQFFAETARLV